MNNRFKSKLIFAFMCAAALAGCATKPATFTLKDPQVDLYAFKTFAFLTPLLGIATALATPRSSVSR